METFCQDYITYIMKLFSLGLGLVNSSLYFERSQGHYVLTTTYFPMFLPEPTFIWPLSEDLQKRGDVNRAKSNIISTFDENLLSNVFS